MTRLPVRNLERRVRVRCQLDDAGIPTQCRVLEADVPENQSEVAICMAQQARFQQSDGVAATSRPVTVPITLHMIASPVRTITLPRRH